MEPSKLLLFSWSIAAETSGYCVWQLSCKVHPTSVSALGLCFSTHVARQKSCLWLGSVSPPLKQCVSVGALHPAWLLTAKWLFSAGHLGSINVLGNLPCQTIVGKGHVRLSKSSDSSSHLSPAFIRSFEAICLLSCHYIDSLLLRIINIVRAVHCLCSPANYKRQKQVPHKSCTLEGINQKGPVKAEIESQALEAAATKHLFGCCRHNLLSHTQKGLSSQKCKFCTSRFDYDFPLIFGNTDGPENGIAVL